MLKVLSRRWLGVTVWAYLLALLLAKTVYWYLVPVEELDVRELGLESFVAT
jgi:hypothetical protein